MIVIYTGAGKGKTSAALGQALRALGHELRVIFAQFVKRGGVAGEQALLERLLGSDFLAGGLGFFKDRGKFEEHRAASRNALDWVLARLRSGVQVCILDESLYALQLGLILREEMDEILGQADEHGVHLVLTGRDAPEWLIDQADVVTEMVCRKHHFQEGRTAVRGIEF